MKKRAIYRNLYISQTIILFFLVIVYFLWFPHSFVKLGGFYKTAWMLIFVDLVLGPLLVFLVYKEGKKHLTFDLNVLLTIQLIAFVFGAHSLFLKHPAYAVFSVDRFVLTNVSNIYPQPSLFDQIKKYLFSSTELVVAHLPTEINARNNLTFEVIMDGKPDIDSRPEYFSPLEQNIVIVMNKSIQLNQLALNSNSKQRLALFTKKYGDNLKHLAFFPLRGNNKKDVIWVLDKKTAKPIAILDIDPWKFKVASNQLSK